MKISITVTDRKNGIVDFKLKWPNTARLGDKPTPAAIIVAEMCSAARAKFKMVGQPEYLKPKAGVA